MCAHLTPREQAWVILSDLFVDTEPDDADLCHMGQQLRVLGLWLLASLIQPHWQRVVQAMREA